MSITASDFIQPGESLQRAKRGYHDAFTDQHGRMFAAVYDLGNQRPIGEFDPVGCEPKWLPPMRFIKWERPGSFRFRWDYASMAAELSGDAAEYYQNVAVFITDHMPHETVPEVGEAIPPKVRRILGNPPLSPMLPLACEAGDPWILGMPGAPVNTLLKTIIEMHAGANGKEALLAMKDLLAKYAKESGVAVVETIPAEAAPVTVSRSINSAAPLASIDPEKITYNDFVKECKGKYKEMAMPDIVSAWREHRANLKDAA